MLQTNEMQRKLHAQLERIRLLELGQNGESGQSLSVVSEDAEQTLHIVGEIVAENRGIMSENKESISENRESISENREKITRVARDQNAAIHKLEQEVLNI